MFSMLHAAVSQSIWVRNSSIICVNKVQAAAAVVLQGQGAGREPAAQRCGCRARGRQRRAGQRGGFAAGRSSPDAALSSQDWGCDHLTVGAARARPATWGHHAAVPSHASQLSLGLACGPQLRCSHGVQEACCGKPWQPSRAPCRAGARRCGRPRGAWPGSQALRQRQSISNGVVCLTCARLWRASGSGG